MKTVLNIVVLSVFCSFCDCSDQNTRETTGNKADSAKVNTTDPNESFKNVTFKPIMGERISIIGDFDGNGIPDTLIEEYISQLTNKETCKDYQPVNLKAELTHEEELMLTDTLMSLICANKPLVRLRSTGKKIKTLTLPNYCNLTGFAYLINLGDLNHVKGDDLAIVTDDIRFAGTTDRCHIYSYINNSWKEVFSFAIREDSYEISDIKTKIPEYLEKRNDKWYYQDYNCESTDSVSEGNNGKMKLLKIK